MATKNLSEYNAAKVPDASNMTFGIVVSEWNPEICWDASFVVRHPTSTTSVRVSPRVLPV